MDTLLDGLSTSLAGLSLAGISRTTWARQILPLRGVLFGLGLIARAVVVATDYARGGCGGSLGYGTPSVKRWCAWPRLGVWNSP